MCDELDSADPASQSLQAIRYLIQTGLKARTLIAPSSNSAVNLE